MRICDSSHPTIVYSSDDYSDCPICEAIEELEDARDLLEDRLTEAEGEIIKLKETIDDLQKSEE